MQRNLVTPTSWTSSARTGARAAILASTLVLGLVVACGDDEETTSVPPTTGFELVGEWATDFGDQTITETDWSGSALVFYDNDANLAVTQTPTSADFFPGKFNKIEYTEPVNGAFFFCTVFFEYDTAQQARTSTLTADATDPTMGGCGVLSFPWTEMRRK